MKIKFSNLGCIKETELELRPLTVIIGPNNSSKTYLAYSIYGLWQRARRTLHNDIEQLELKQNNEGILSLKIDDNLFDFFITDAEEIAQTFEGSYLESFFQDSSRKLFSKTSFNMIISRLEIEDIINKLTKEEYFPLNNKFSVNTSRKENILFWEFKRIDEDESLNINQHLTDTDVEFAKLVFAFSVKERIFLNPLPFPAERNAFINTYKMLANRRYKFLKENQRELFSRSGSKRQLELLKEQGDIRYPQPVEDFLDFLTDIELQKPIKITANEKNEFQKLADQIEIHIQNRNKTNLKPTKLGGQEIKVRVKTGLEIDLYNASSSIKQLAPLLLYLRFRAKRGDFLVIDEPEMNLHPESQAKLLEALAILVNLGVRILLTTHSPYIMAHLNNLVNGKTDDTKILEHQSLSLYLKDKRAFLEMDKVSAYEMKDDQLVSLNDPDYGIRWDTLSDVSVDIQQKFFEIYEIGHTNNNETEE